MTSTTVEVKGKGHFLVSYMDGQSDQAFYDVSLAMVMKLVTMQTPYREPKSISWIEDKE